MPLENIDVGDTGTFYEDLAQHALVPGWAKREPAMWPKPKPKYKPFIWRYTEARAALDKACEFVSPEKAERRNLILVDPIEGNNYPTCRHLVAAYQLVLPGETARSHRHAPNALRIVLDAGPETYTIVNGVRVDVGEGDVVLTPSWHWHGHSNHSDRPAFWIDILDVPLVQNLENMFFEDYPGKIEHITSNQPDSPLRYKHVTLAEGAARNGRYTIDQQVIRTMEISSIAVPRGETIAHERRIINSIYTVISGKVELEMEGMEKTVLTRGDVMVAPNWHAYSLIGVTRESQLIEVSDAPVFAALGFQDR